MAEEHAITRQDVDEVAGHLQEWAKSLPEQEQLVLGWMLSRAAAADNAEVAGYNFQPGLPFSQTLAHSVGFGNPGLTRAGGNTVSVSWGRSFSPAFNQGAFVLPGLGGQLLR